MDHSHGNICLEQWQHNSHLLRGTLTFLSQFPCTQSHGRKQGEGLLWWNPPGSCEWFSTHCLPFPFPQPPFWGPHQWRLLPELPYRPAQGNGISMWVSRKEEGMESWELAPIQHRCQAVMRSRSTHASFWHWGLIGFWILQQNLWSMESRTTGWFFLPHRSAAMCKLSSVLDTGIACLCHSSKPFRHRESLTEWRLRWIHS